MKGLTTKLRALGAAVEELTDGYINHGGCCVYAAAVAKRLEALGIQVECVTRARGGPVEVVRNNLRNDGNDPTSSTARDWYAAGLDTYHVGVRFKHSGRWYTHDTEATRGGRDVCGDRLEFECTPDGLTPDEAHAMAEDPRGWNASFDRDYIPHIRELVEEYLQ